MKIKILCLLFLVSFYNCIHAQHTLTGKVNDNQNKPIAFANILLLRPSDSSLVKGALTDDFGLFSIENIKTGTYMCSVSLIGFQTFNQIINVSSDKDLSEITLLEKTEELSEVVVSVSKPLFERKIDRLVVNVQNSITSAGGTALEVLERSPSVAIDRSRNLISLSGKDGVLIMINGKISRQPIEAIMQMLNSMNADNIEKIELITSPPSRYEAAGNAGIINIQMVKSTDLGVNGTLSLFAGYGKEDKEGGSFNFNSRKNRMNLFGNISISRDHSDNLSTNNRVVDEVGESITSQTISDRDPITKNFNGRLGLDYSFNEKTTLGGFISGFRNRWNMEAVSTGFELSSISPNSFFKVDTQEKNQWNHLMGNLNLNQKLGDSLEMEINLDYLYYENENPTDYVNTYRNEQEEISSVENVRAQKETPVSIWVGSTDFTNKLSDKLNWEFGAKIVNSVLDNNVLIQNQLNGEFITDLNLSENSNLTETIGGLYTTFNYNINTKTQLKAGLRYEYSNTNLSTQMEDQVVDLEYSDFFPTFYFSREIAKETNLIISYGRRINRPSFNDLAPFVIFLDPNTFFFGNTALQPSRTNSFKFDIKFKEFLLSTEYNNETNAISRYQPTFLEDTNQQVFTSLNLDYRDTYSILFSVPIKISNWWNLNLNVMGIGQRLKTQENEKLNEIYWRVNGSQNFIISPSISFEFSGFYQTESLDGIAKTGNYGNLSFGAQKIFNDNHKLRFTFDNIFGFQYSVFTAQDLNRNFMTNTNYRFEPRIFKLTYSYSFGNGKLKSERKRATGSEEIKERVQ